MVREKKFLKCDLEKCKTFPFCSLMVKIINADVETIHLRWGVLYENDDLIMLTLMIDNS